MNDGSLGRLGLLLSAYAPAAVIVGLRSLPGAIGVVAVVLGAMGAAAWVFFLRYATRQQERRVTASEVEVADGEVTGYIASLLLPIVAAGTPSLGDQVAYALCAVLLLIVAYAADLGAVNPVIYLCGLRVVRCKIDAKPYLMIVDRVPPSGATLTVTNVLGILRLIRVEGSWP